MKNLHLKALIAVALVGIITVPARGAEVTNTTGSFEFSASAANKTFVVPGSVDLTAVTVSSNDTIVVIDIPSNTVLDALQYAVAVTNGSALTFDIGDSNSTTQFVGAASANTLTPALVTVNANTRRLYTANDGVRVRVSGAAPTGATINVKARLIDLR